MSNDEPNKPTGARGDVCAPRSTPSAAWVCGYAELGKCCASGPTSKGGCGLTAQNAASDAATADQQLAPCIPRRSHQWRRQSLSLNLAILTGGVLLLCIALPSREKTFVPGELSSKHAQILDNTLVSQRCGLCHPNSHVGAKLEHHVAHLLMDRLVGGEASKADRSRAEPSPDGAQDALCMQCHKGHMPGALQRTPHDLSAATLRAIADGEDVATWQSVGERATQLTGSDAHHAEQAHTRCADCHIEHYGRGFELKAMTDDRCQACHRRKFESFASGHPEFKNFPAERPRSLAFSHQLHAGKHFPQKNREFDCRSCHLGQSGTADARTVTRSVRFETACAECHQEPIQAATTDGWAVLQLPSVDAAAAGSGSLLAHWPAEARFGFEGTISPALRALLEADETAQEALAQLPASGELRDIPSLGDQREHVTQSLALATERLIRETARDGQGAWHKRLSKVTRARTGREPNQRELAVIQAMCAGLPPDLFRHMQTAWFDESKPLAVSRPADAEENATIDAIPSSSASRSSSHSPPELQRIATDRSQGILVERNRNSLLVSDNLVLEPAANDRVASEDDLLLEETPTADSDQLLSDSLESSLLDSPLSDASPREAAAATPLAGSSHLAAGGWFLDRETLALRYMPAGHADKTLAAWNMWWTLVGDATQHEVLPEETEPAIPSAVASSVREKIPGGCLQCHQLDRSAREPFTPTSSPTIAWQVPQRRGGLKEFTKFDHEPHLRLPAVSDCRYCHVLREDSSRKSLAGDGADTYGPLVSGIGHVQNPHSLSEFRGMQLAQCVACHRPSGANSGCLQCHNYHVTLEPPGP